MPVGAFGRLGRPKVRRLILSVVALVGAYGSLAAGAEYLRDHHLDRWRYVHVVPLAFAFSVALRFLRDVIVGSKSSG